MDQDRFEAGVVGSWNVWDFGVLGNKIKAKEAEREEVFEDGRVKTKELEDKLKRLILDLKVSLSRIGVAKSLFNEKREVYQNEKTRFIAQDKGELEIHDSFVNVIKAEMEVIDVLSDYRLLKARLERVLSREEAA